MVFTVKIDCFSKNVIKLYGDGSLAWVYAALGSTCARSTAGGSNRSGKRSRGGDGSDKRNGTDEFLKLNPELKFANDQRGYLTCEVTPDAWTTRAMVMDQVSAPGGQIRARAWELLLAMLVMEAAFGIAGVVAAPIYYAYLKRELEAAKLI